jgi:16S rRNA (adenine1518-N6/adenine1519-N6)-dimethyltransferase
MTDGQLLGARRLRELFESHGIRPHKELGQNFVVDPNTIRKVVDVAGDLSDKTVLEIGAGAGSLTLGLARAAGRVIAVEFDDRMVPALRESLLELDNVEIVVTDAMKLDYSTVDATEVVANLPYNIAVPLVITVLENAPQITSLTVMTQREVGERLAAIPGGKSYGQVSVLVGYWARAAVASRISRNAFYPVPAVDSVLVRIVRRETPPIDYARLSDVVKTAFGQRRKTLRNTLAPLGSSVSEVEDTIRAAGIDPGARPETVSLSDWVAITRQLVSSETSSTDTPNLE